MIARLFPAMDKWRYSFLLMIIPLIFSGMSKSSITSDHEVLIKKYNLLLQAPEGWIISTDKHAVATVIRTRSSGPKDTAFGFCMIEPPSSETTEPWVDQLAQRMAVHSGANQAVRQGEEESLKVDGLEARALTYQVQTPQGLFLREFVSVRREKDICLLTFWGLQANVATDHEIFKKWLEEGVFLTAGSIKERKIRTNGNYSQENNTTPNWNKMKRLDQMPKEEILKILRKRRGAAQGAANDIADHDSASKDQRIIIVGPNDGRGQNLQKALEKDGINASVISTD